MTTTEEKLEELFANRRPDGFIHLEKLHEIVAQGDQRPSIQLLSAKKLKDVAAGLVKNGIQTPVSQENGQTFIHQELALALVSHRRADLSMTFVRLWRNKLDDPLAQVIKQVPALEKRVFDIFAYGLRYVKIDGTFFFAAVDMARLVLWDENKRTPTASDVAKDIKRVALKDGELKQALTRMHLFRPGNPSSILNINDTARLWMVLPGARATAFRSQLISCWVRVFGGDMSLIDEIRSNNQIQKELPESHPARAFGDAAGLDRADDGQVESIHTRLDGIETSIQTISGLNGSVLTLFNEMNDRMTENAREIKTLIQTQQFEQMDHTSGITMDCVYHHLERSIAAPATSGITDYDFRVEFHGFILAVADILFTTLGKRHANDTAGFLEEALNISVDFGDTVPRKWSSLSVRALLQTGAKLRTRYWICQRRGLAYPNAAVNKEIQHSTYLDLGSYYSIIAHIRRVWDDHQYVGELALARMMDVLVWKFGGDIEPGDIDLGITVLYGARRARTDTQHQPASSQRTIDAFFHHQDEPEPVLERRKRARVDSEIGV